MKQILLALLTLALGPGAFGQFSSDVESPNLDPLEEFRAETLALRDPLAELRQAVEPEPVDGGTAVRQVLDLGEETRGEETEGAEPFFQPIRAAGRGAGDDGEFIGRLSANPFAADSTSNPYSPAGSPYASRSVNNPYGQYGSPYSPRSARNPLATDAPRIVAEDGTYLGRLSENPYDPDSTANPYGRYGSRYSSTSIRNPYSPYGSPYSSQSPHNPFTARAPLLFGEPREGRGPDRKDRSPE